MATPEIRKFAGLYLQANSFNVPDGAMEIAENIVIQNDDIVSKTKGYFEYWRPGGEALVGIKALTTYQGQLIGAFSNGMGHFAETFPYGGTYNSVGVLTQNTGATAAFTKACYFEKANSNLYATGLDGIYRLEAFTSPLRKAGVPPGLSLTITDTYGATGVLQPDSQTGYRAVFGRRDLNGNLLLSAPSDTAYIGVGATESVNYIISGGIVTVSCSQFTFLTGKPDRIGQKVIIAGATNSALDGVQTITDNFQGGQIEFATGEADSTGTLDISALSTPTIEIDIPSEITDLTQEWFVQVYRTTGSLSVNAAPTPDFKLTTEQFLTQTDLNLKFVRFTDKVDFLLLGAELYTNENSREGELQRNDRPNKANAMAQYKGYMLYGDVTTVQRMTLDAINISGLATDITFKQGAVEEVYIDAAGIDASPGQVTGTGTGTITATSTVVFINSGPQVGDVFEIYDITGTLSPGVYTVSAVVGSAFSFSAPGKTMTAGTVSFLKRGTSINFDATTYSTITDVQSLELAVESLIRAINRNSSFMYANYGSTFDQFPGKILIQSKVISDPIYVRVGGITSPPAFIQPVPDSFLTGKQIYSENAVEKNALYWSKVGEPEAQPPLNSFYIGQSTARLLCIIPLRDCVIIVKEDGVFKLSGDSQGDFQITPIDTTLKFPGEAIRAAAGINNVAMGLSNQGIVRITDSSVQVVSRRIDDAIQPLVILDLARTYLHGNEADRLFYTNTNGINAGDPDVNYLHNVINETWTTSTSVYTSMGIGPDDANYGIRFDAGAGADVIERQRKTETLVDYCGKYAVGTISVAVDKLSATFLVTGGNVITPEAGDAFLYGNVFTRIKTSVLDSGFYTLTFVQPTSIPSTAPLSVTFFKAYRSTMKMAPFHAGQVGLEKHFSQMQIHLRQPALSDCLLNFGGAYVSGSGKTDWNLSDVSTEGASGWGYAPWGFFPWGLPQGIKLSGGSRAASIIRTYVPRLAARSTYVQLMLQHQIAGQPLLIQALVYTCRGYGDRTSR